MNWKALQPLLKKAPPVLWFTIILVVIFAFSSNRYVTTRNLINVLQQGAVLLIIASGATMIILSGGLDLASGAVLTVSGIMSVLALNAGAPVPLAILVGMVTGAGAGAVSGTLVAILGMPPFIATLGMQGVLFGVSLALTSSTGVLAKNPSFMLLGGTLERYVPMAAICAAVVFTGVWFVLHHTAFGRYVVAIGGNETGAHLSGVDTRFWKLMVWIFAGLVSGVGGVVLAARLEVADPIVGVGWDFDAIAATILGGTAFKFGKGNVTGTIFGVLLITVVRNGLNVIRTPSIWQPAIIGTVLILALVFHVWATKEKVSE